MCRTMAEAMIKVHPLGVDRRNICSSGCRKSGGGGGIMLQLGVSLRYAKCCLQLHVPCFDPQERFEPQIQFTDLGKLQ